MATEAIFNGDLRGHDFAGRDLSGAVFFQADLYRASFANCILDNAVLVNCFVAEANFTKAQCQGLQARNCNFFRASFACGDLTGALLWRCILAGANMRGAVLRDITLTLNCDTFERVQLDSSANVELAFLFSRADLQDHTEWLEHVASRNLARLEKVFSQ